MTGVFIKRGQWDTDTHREDHVNTEEEDGHIQSKERVLKINRTIDTLISDFSSLEV